MSLWDTKLEVNFLGHLVSQRDIIMATMDANFIVCLLLILYHVSIKYNALLPLVKSSCYCYQYFRLCLISNLFFSLCQTSLICIIPAYHDQNLTKNRKVQLVTNCAGKVSEPLPFTYHPGKTFRFQGNRLSVQAPSL